jgi:hypothetical protein
MVLAGNIERERGERNRKKQKRGQRQNASKIIIQTKTNPSKANLV